MVNLGKSAEVLMKAKLLGSGEKCIILAHGFGGDQTIWDRIVPHLTSSFRVLLFDWNFSGSLNDRIILESTNYPSFESYTDELIALVDEMNLKYSVFLGHSMSGMIGCFAAIKRPELFQSLILLGASPCYLNVEGYEGGFERSILETIFTSIASDFHSWASGFASVAVGVDDPVSVDKFRRSLMNMRPDIALSLAKSIFLSDFREILEKIEVPCTIIQNRNDVIVPVSVSHYMKNQMKTKSQVFIIESDGHFPQLTAPRSLLNIFSNVLDFKPNGQIF